MVKKIKNTLSMIFLTFRIVFHIPKRFVFLIYILNFFQAINPYILLQINGRLINDVISGKITTIIHTFCILILFSCFNIFCGKMYNYILLKYQYDLNFFIETYILKKSKCVKYSIFEDSELYDKLKRASENAVIYPYILFVTTLSLINKMIQLISIVILLTNARILHIEFLFIISAILIIPNFHIIKQEYNLQKELVVLNRKKKYYRDLLETMPSLKEIRIFNTGDTFLKKFEGVGKDINNKVLSHGRKRNMMESVSTLIISALSWYYNFSCISNTIKGIYSIGEMSIYIQTISKVNAVITDTLSALYNIYKTSLFIEHLFEYLMLEEENCDQELLLNNVIREKGNTLTFNNVTFRYPFGSRTVLKEISFELEEGEILGIIGENGSGKSTILNLLCRLYEPQNGEIMLNDISISKINLAEWRNSLKVTIQDFIKYDFSLKDNITLGEAEDDNFRYLVNSVGVNKIAEKLSSGYNSQLGVMFDNGVQLSQGEWQKIAVCRSLYKNGLILILDEPSAALDNKSEEMLLRTVKSMLKKQKVKFAIFITHNRNNLQYADKALELSTEGAILRKLQCK